MKTKFQQLLDVINYGVDWQRDFRGDSQVSYTQGTLDATAFIASCIIVQDFCYSEGLGASDMKDFLELDEAPTPKQVEKNLRRMFKFLELDTHEKA